MQAAHNIEELLDGKVSNSIKQVLTQAPAQFMGDRPPQVTVATFLFWLSTGAKVRTETRTIAQDIFGKAAVDRRFDRIFKDVVKSERGEVSDGLYQAFDEAKQIRAITGGQDDFIGLRHILLAIVTCREGPLADEAAGLFSMLELDRAKAEHKVVNYCTKIAIEPGESIEAWQKILADRGLSFPSDTPSPAKPQVRARGPEVAVLDADDPWLARVVDRSGAGAEAEAFATMIRAQSFKPPIAVGVFGEWGSGKSFFMKLVYQAVERQIARAEREAEEKPDDPPGDFRFLSNIVQIRFNAWHYADTNLWASLIDHIFTSLDRWAERKNAVSETEKLFEQLATARRLTVESAETLIKRRRDRDQAAANLTLAQQDLDRKREDLEKSPVEWLNAAWSAMTSNTGEKERLDHATRVLGLADTVKNANDLGAAAAELDDALAQHSIFKSATLRALSLAPVIILVTLGVVVLPPLLAKLTAMANDHIVQVAAAISGALAPVGAALTWATHRTRTAIGTVNSFKAELDARVSLLSAQESAEKSRREQELAASEAAAAEAEERLRIASEKAAEAAREYNFQSGKGRVLRFVRDRVQGGDYEKHLSFVATVRKDFEELSELMTSSEPEEQSKPSAARKELEAHKDRVDQVLADGGELLTNDEKDKLRGTTVEDSSGPIVFERIVLYIDDLDRCPPKQVVAVLEAIHLLLTFRLFVVFVAVDVRWLRHALIKEYPGQLTLDDPDETASPSDYLEKIFQLPYWVRSMTADNTRSLLGDRLGPRPKPATKEDSSAKKDGGKSDIQEHDEESAPDDASTDENGDTQPASVPVTKLQLTPDEWDYIQALADSFDHSPRRTLRFINTYRIIKASFNAAELDALEAGGYKALLTLLSLTVTSENGDARALRTISGTEALRGIAIARRDGSPGRLRAETAVAQFNKAKGDGAQLHDYAAVVGRFGFDPAGD